MPRSSRVVAAEHRSAVVNAAAGLLRSGGPTAVTVAAASASAGLTHGGFYKTFASKQALVGEACELAVEQRRDATARVLASAAGTASAPAALVAAYLAEAHRDRPEQGCVLPALAADAARSPGSPLAQSYRHALADLIGALESSGLDRFDAVDVMTRLVGAVVLARAVDGDLSDEILVTARRALLADAGPGGTSVSD